MRRQKMLLPKNINFHNLIDVYLNGRWLILECGEEMCDVFAMNFPSIYYSPPAFSFDLIEMEGTLVTEGWYIWKD